MSLHFVSHNGKHLIEIPPLSGLGNPSQRLPKCPVCEERELTVLNADSIMCYNCDTYFYYRKPTRLEGDES